MAYADYSHPTGTGGRLLIRVYDWNDPSNPHLVQFFIQAGNTQTYANGKGWSWSASNGNGGGGTFNYSGGQPLLHIGNIWTDVSLTVHFSIGATGTQGLGGPTTFSLWIFRPTVPAAPTPVAVDQATPTSLRYRFSGNSNGGLAIAQWQFSYSTGTTAGSNLTTSTGTSVVSGLLPATTYYFWARGRNAKGWGPWSARSSGRTLAAGRIKVNGVWRYAMPYVKVNGVWKLALPFIKSGGTWRRTG